MLKIQLHCIVYKQEIFKNSGLQSDYKIIPSLTDAVTSVDGYYDDSGLIQQERPQRQVPVPQEFEDLVVKGKAADFLNTFHKIVNNYCNILLFNVVSHAVTRYSIDSSFALLGYEARHFQKLLIIGRL